MEEVNNLVTDECVEVLVQTRGDEPKLIQEAGRAGENYGPSFSSFETLIRTAMALEEDPRDEHSYAYSDKKQAFEGKEKDHCYSAYSKLAHRKVQSLSDENLYRSTESDLINDSTLILPHYHSKDSALDVTGFDTISEKCLSYDNINVKTVDVVTDRCILPGFSDPDISKMTLKNDENIEKSFSVPNSPPSKGEHLTIEHNYFKSIGNKMVCTRKFPPVSCQEDNGEKSVPDKSPLLDHSYDTSQKRKSLPGNSRLKRGRSSEKVDSLSHDEYLSLNTQDLMKSPFLDHSYQSFELKNVGKRQNIGKKFYSTKNITCDKSEKRNYDMSLPVTGDSGHAHLSKQFFHDHAYEQISDSGVGDLWLRSRSYSMSETKTTRSSFLKSDHSYTVQNNSVCIEENSLNDNALSDSGRESLNDDEEETMSTTVENLDTFRDHSYVTAVR